MSNAANNVVDAIVAKILELDSFSADRVHLGPFLAAKVDAKPHVIIEVVNDSKEAGLADDDGQKRTMELAIGMLLRTDPGSANAGLKQANQIYDLMHAKLESLRSGSAGNFARMIEDDAGKQYQTLIDDKQSLRAIACRWTVIYTRDNEAT